MGDHDAANDETAFQRHADEFVFRAERHPDQLLQDDRQSERRQQRFSDLAVQPADQRQFDQRPEQRRHQEGHQHGNEK